MQKIGEKLFRWRYLIGIFLFISCVVLELHGSSLNVWLEWLPGGQQNSELVFGKLRNIRSDEWAVFTPLTLAQKDNPLGAFSYFSTLTRGGMTDSFIVYGQPVWNPMMIFRIFQAGYLFFSAGKGMAFFWNGREIALFLVTIELGMVLTNKNKLLSTALAFMVLFAPMIQWWYAINGLVEMLITGQLAVLVVHYYMRTTNYWFRFILILLLIWCGGTYILTFYPAWMVSFGYVWLVLIISVIVNNRKKFYWNWKCDGLLVLVFFVLFGGSMVYTFHKSWDCVQAVLNSAYPGKRVSVGGQVPWTALLAGSNLFFPYRTEMIPFLRRAEMPVCEFALFMDFFPIGTLFAIYVMIRRNKADCYLILLFLVDSLFACYTLIPFPEWLAKVTLLSFSSSNRVAETITFVRLLELFRAVGLYAKQKSSIYLRQKNVRNRKKRKRRNVIDYRLLKIKFMITAVLSVITAVIMGIVNRIILLDYLRIIDTIIIIFVFFFVGFLVWNSNYRRILTGFCVLVIGISLIVGMTVNPLQKGLKQVKENPLVVQMKQIDQEDPGIWITEYMQFPYGNIPLLAGVASLNATNVYPNVNQWAILDSNRTQEEIYNRYAHICMRLVNESASFTLNGTDMFSVDLNPHDLARLNVKYILSNRNLEQFTGIDYRFERKAQIEQFQIYKVIRN